MDNKSELNKNNPHTSSLLKKIRELIAYAMVFMLSLAITNAWLKVLRAYMLMPYVESNVDKLAIYSMVFIVAIFVAIAVKQIEYFITVSKKQKKQNTKGVIYLNISAISLFDDDDLLDELINRGVLTKIDTTDGSTVYEYIE